MATTRPHLLTGVIGRTILAIGVLSIVLLFSFFVLLRSLSSEREASAMHRGADEAAASINELERVVIAVESAEQTLLNRSNLQSLTAHAEGRQLIPEYRRELEAISVDPAQDERLAAISAALGRYADEWLEVVLSEAEKDLAAAQALVASGEGAERATDLHTLFSEFEESQDRILAARREEVDAAADRSIQVTYILLGVVLLALAGAVVTTYFQVTRPVESLVETTARFAEGDLTARVTETGIPELRALGSALNEMAEGWESARAKLAQRGAELKAVLDATADGILVADPEGRLVFNNAAAAKLWPSELPIEERGAISDIFHQLAAMSTTPHMWDGEARRLADNPDAEVTSEFTLQSTGQSFVGYTGPVRSTDGEPIGRIFVVRDISTEREAERGKDQFVATVSHELRTPLTSILGYLELVLEDQENLDEQQTQFLKVAERNAIRLHELVGDLLVVYQIQSDRLIFDIQRIDIAALIGDALETIRAPADRKKLQLQVTSPSSAWIVGDRLRLSDMVGNLLSNAVKFTPEGGQVEVRLDMFDGSARIEVADSGIGIDKDDLDQLFERFFRASTAREAAVPGTGLGLAICKAIAEGHGGSISVSSEVGTGTRFTVELPVGSDVGGAQ